MEAVLIGVVLLALIWHPEDPPKKPPKPKRFYLDKKVLRRIKTGGIPVDWGDPDDD